ncbi:hypothetical protein HWQ46_05135 [Shewanella sp. D64]|uniref:hypothetical protein n=1 Tax=unclassified Shewanella TaxID=196818 RepID=UPI0022BA1AF2|nr:MULTISPECIES: hypothetical protein [unclassified Shewanella]MEC4724935.1 hypothetical protein [Shewanella sp. D64]MEC4736272.1 hypothetical protein [Shewanella sp. E94]WBJ97664.1 hypothetical protein HWQ47_11505 [Shewanella sp. MTB7]
MKYGLRKFSINRLFILFVMVLVFTAGIYVFFENKKIDEEKEIQLRKKQQQASQLQRVRDGYTSMLGGAQLDSLLKLYSNIKTSWLTFDLLEKKVDSVSCKFSSNVSAFSCKMEVDNNGGYFSIPSILFMGKEYSPIINKTLLTYEGLQFSLAKSRNLIDFESDRLIDIMHCNDVLVNYGVMNNMLQPLGAKLSISTPTRVAGEQSITTTNINNNFYFGGWEFQGPNELLGMLYFAEHDATAHEIQLDFDKELINLKGIFSCTM